MLEGKATFEVGSAFYNPKAEMVRDLAILAAAIYRRDRGHLRVLDAMAGCGVRSLRYTLESQADFVWANDSNSDIQDILHQNLAQLKSTQYRISDRDAIRVFFDCYNQQDYYDLVDVDGFGSPVPYVHACLSACAIGGMIYLTSTDGRTVTGRAADNCLSDYGAVARSHPAIHEQGLRLILGNVQQQAASRGMGIEPVFSYFTGQTYRVMVRLVSSIQLNEKNYGFLGFCHECGTYQTVGWRSLGRSHCPHDQRWLVVSGAMWLGKLHDVLQITQMIKLAKEWGWISQVRLLELMQAEAEMPPYFYTLGEIGRRGKLDIPKSNYLIQTLKELGYRASLTHVDREAIKTDADLKTCVRIARTFSS